jgi:hypothetical protein
LPASSPGLEDRLTHALHDEADARAVDVQRLYGDTLDRLGSAPARNPGVRFGPLVAAAVVLILGAGIGGLRMLDVDILQGLPATGPAHGGVEDTFTCPTQHTIRFDAANDDDSFLPGLDRRRRPVADATRAPRYEVTDEGDLTLLRLGNADGTLASVSMFRSGPDGYRLVEVTRCQGDDGSILVPVPGAGTLGRHAGPAWDPAQVPHPERHDGLVVDDRAYYDTAGLSSRRAIWVTPCERNRVCVTGGIETSMITARLRPGGLEPRDLTAVFLPPDEMVGKRSPYLLVGLWDRDTEVTGVTWTDSSGNVTPIEALTGSWEGRVFLVLAPDDDIRSVEVRLPTGATSFPAAELRGRD